MHRRFRRSQLPVGLAVAVAAVVPGTAAAAPDNTTADLAAPVPAAMRWADGRPLSIVRRLAVQRSRVRAVHRRALGAVHAARAQIGDAYAYGASGPGAFDCSGLTAYAMRRAGVSLPHSSFAQAGTGTPVARDDIRAGDLVFFSTAGAGASHVGIATGHRTVVSATNSGVMEHATDDAYWGAHYVSARRLL